jgi:hypothetical protein
LWIFKRNNHYIDGINGKQKVYISVKDFKIFQLTQPTQPNHANSYSAVIQQSYASSQPELYLKLTLKLASSRVSSLSVNPTLGVTLSIILRLALSQVFSMTKLDLIVVSCRALTQVLLICLKQVLYQT